MLNSNAMHRLGERIKRMRDHRSMQLNDLAKRVGISSSALSQIEKGKTYPSILTLKQIADQLFTTVGELIGENEVLSNNPFFSKGDYLLVESNETGASVFLVSRTDVSKQFETVLVQFKQHSDSSDLLRYHQGYFFCYLLKGEVLFEIDSKSYVVQPGDTLYFNAKRNYRFENLAHATSELLIVRSH